MCDCNTHPQLIETIKGLVGALEEARDQIASGRIYERMCCDGHMCGCQGSPNSDYVVHCINEVLTRAKPLLTKGVTGQ